MVFAQRMWHASAAQHGTPWRSKVPRDSSAAHLLALPPPARTPAAYSASAALARAASAAGSWLMQTCNRAGSAKVGAVGVQCWSAGGEATYAAVASLLGGLHAAKVCSGGSDNAALSACCSPSVRATRTCSRPDCAQSIWPRGCRSQMAARTNAACTPWEETMSDVRTKRFWSDQILQT